MGAQIFSSLTPTVITDTVSDLVRYKLALVLKSLGILMSQADSQAPAFGTYSVLLPFHGEAVPKRIFLVSCSHC